MLRALARAEPELGVAFGAAVWRGGASPLEAVALDLCTPLVVYGEQAALDDLALRARGPVIAFGPAFSVAVLHREASDEEIAGLAHDVALGDQRGCLSLHAIVTTGDAAAFARRLASALARLARGSLPPGPADMATGAAARQAFDEAVARGLAVYGTLQDGAVIVEPDRISPSPGRRLVRVVPAAGLADALALLLPWRGSLQGAGLLHDAPAELLGAMGQLGASRVAAPGELHRVGPFWRNAGVDLLEVF
jgi:hypothetical protein